MQTQTNQTDSGNAPSVKRETLEQAGYLSEYEEREDGEVVLTDRETGNREVWFRNDGHASYGIVIGGHDYEFARSIPYNLNAVRQSNENL